MAKNDIEEEIARLVAHGALGRSTVYARLLRYLADASARGALPKEVDIATDVLDKAHFEPGTDSTVRVYVHNLRQKLDSYYTADTSGRTARLIIPKGKYQLILQSGDYLASKAVPAGGESRRIWLTAVIVGLMLAAFVLGQMTRPGLGDSQTSYADSPIWQAIVDDNDTVVVVVGDYYMFAEGSSSQPGERLIRDFSINSSADFNDWIASNPELADRYTDIRLSYLPVGMATALNDVLRVLHKQTRNIRIIPQSQFHPRMLRLSHVVYVGYVSGLGSLDQYLFSASRLMLGNSYDELVDIESGERFVSNAGYVTDDFSSYTDYGFVSTFPGPSNNQFLFVTGMRDEGLMRMAATIADPIEVSKLGASGSSFEALYRVSGIDRTHVAAQKLFTATIDASEIWLQSTAH